MHLAERRVADNLHRVGEFHGVPGERVDGNDVIAVFQAAARAAGRARSGGGPSLLECRTFRWRGHVGASTDVDVGVRRRGELAEWLERDPIQRAAAELCGRVELGEVSQVIEDEMASALARARQAPHPPPERVLRHVWQEGER
jgi:pyruvate dehydrogenase E1 component alpha subunit